MRGVATNPAGFNAHDPERSERMCALFRDGYTLQQIADMHGGLSRERVRQVITKRDGLRRNDGGKHKVSVERKAVRRAQLRARRDARCLRIWGIDHATLLRLNGGKASRAKGSLAALFLNQKRCAGFRQVPWELSFPQWVEIWHASGHLQERGRGRDKYVMARKGDHGPYAVDNVYIATAADNARDYQSRRRGVDYSDPSTPRRRKRGRVTGYLVPVGKVA
ncbi:MAG: hypothetical protein ACREO3_08110 [Arenimonas sp.]